MHQNHTAICLINAFLIGEQTAQGKPLPLSRSNHGGNLDKQPLAAQTAFQIGGPRLGFREERHLSADPNELDGQLQFGESGLAHTIVVVSNASDKTGEPQMAGLIRAMLADRRPPVVEFTREAEFLPFPSRKGLAMPVAQVRNEPKGVAWAKPRHKPTRNA
jgi:hypothetical protein